MFAIIAIPLALCLFWLAFALFRVRRLEKELLLKDEEIVRHKKARVDMLNNIGQEIRTPLNAVVGFSEQLGHTRLEQEQRESLAAVERAAGMLMKMVNNIQDLSRLDKSEMVLQEEPFFVNHVFVEVMNIQRGQAARKQLQFDAVYEGDRLLQVNGDQYRFRQILHNLTDNAVKYTDAGSIKVKLQIHKMPGQQVTLKLTVTDTGRGIPTDTLPFVFEYFARRRMPYDAAVNGTGLGLAITRGLVALHQGNITAESKAGEWSTFSCNVVYNVVHTPQTTVITQREVDHMSTPFMEDMYVLIADDQEMNLLLMDKILTRWKCRFDKAKDGKAAYDLFCANNYDMVLLDLQMPHMTGIEVVKKIRDDKDLVKANIPVLALTSDTTLPDNAAFLEVGFDDCLLKPFRERDIYKTIIRHLHPQINPVVQRVKR